VYAGTYDTYRAVHDAAAAGTAPGPVAEAKKDKKGDKGETPSRGVGPTGSLSAGAGTPAGSTVALKKLTYAERQELDQLYPRIEAGEEEVGNLEALLADPKLYAERAGEVRATKERLDAAKSSLAALYARWEDLEKRKNG
jgi:ATP-binding cassette subfamily F protein uup